MSCLVFFVRIAEMVEAQLMELATAVQSVKAQRGGTDDSASAGGSNGTSFWGSEDWC